MSILEIYKKYQIMPQLAEHQFRVAAVAEVILGHISLVLDRRKVVAACLLHDMGNIVKFDLNKTADMYPAIFVKPEDRLFWENVKQEFIKKYGTGSHNVTVKVVAELGVGERIRELVDSVGFDQGVENAATGDFAKKICAYSDMRVMPNGVCSLEERMADLKVRYKNHPEAAKDKSGGREMFEAALREIEKQIFAYCDIRPDNITEVAISVKKERLKVFEI